MRLYHLVAINEKSGIKTYLSSYPMEHAHAINLLRAQSNRVDYVRVQLEEVIK